MRHGSPSRVGSGQRVVANGESGRGTPDHDAPATIGKRTRKGEEAQETGHGSSEGESSGGQLQGRERHETRPRSVGGLGKRRASQGVRARRDDRPEPSRGARTLRTAPTGVWQPPSARLARASLVDKGAPDVVAFVGARTSREADPHRSRTWSAHAGRGGERCGRASCGGTLQGEPNLKRGSRRNLFLRVGHVEENRAAVPNGEAGALEASKALLGGHNKPLQGTVTLESGSERG